MRRRTSQFVDGAAILERDGRTESAPVIMPLLAGDRVRTQNGRVEVLFADGSTLHLDANTLVDFQSDEVIRLLEGRVRLNIVGPAATCGLSHRRAVGVGADSRARRVPDCRAPRRARSRAAEVELAVLRGGAELVNEDGRTALAGRRARLRARGHWSLDGVRLQLRIVGRVRSLVRRHAARPASASPRSTCPTACSPYSSSFNDYGSWQNEPTYGYVWYPRVAPGWRPYYYGRWASLRP